MKTLEMELAEFRKPKSKFGDENQSTKKSHWKKVWLKQVKETKNPSTQDQLTFEDLKYNLWCVKFLTVIKILPTEMDVTTGLMKMKHTNKNNNGTTYTFKAKSLATMWTLFILARISSLCFDTAYLLSSEGDERESEEMKMLRKVFTTFGTFVCIGLFDGYRDAILAYMHTVNIMTNDLFRNIQRRDLGKDQNSGLGYFQQLKDKLKSLYKRPFRVNLLIHLPFVIYALIAVIPGTMFLDPKSPVLMTSHAVDMKERNFRLIFYIAFTILDHFYWLFIFSLIYYAVFYMLFFMIRIDADSRAAIEQLNLPEDGLETALKSLKLIKLEILLFNLRLSSIVYLTKLIALAAAITGGFLMIKLMHTNPLFALPFLLFFLEGNILYIVLFNNVYEITRKIDVLKEEVLIRTQMKSCRDRNRNRDGDGGQDQDRDRNERKKEEYKRVCASIQRLGIQAGGFATMEREATLIFGDFVTQQIVSLLLTFG